MKLIKLSFYTNHLGHIQSTWVDTENEEVKECLEKANGNYDYDIVGKVADESGAGYGYNQYYLADYRDSNIITVTDENNKEIEYTDILKEKLIDVFDEDEEDGCLYVREMNYEVYGENEVVDGPVPSLLFKKLKENHPDFGKKGLIRTHVQSMLEDCILGSDRIDDELCLLSYGDIGKGIVNYDIWLEDDEEFDINKLGFMFQEDWWDDPDIAEDDGLLDGLYDIFCTTSVILDFVVYDNKVFNRNGDESFIYGYRNPGNIHLIRPDMTPAEL